ncbi:hypothetical protein AB0M54_36505 [Actinoplanes sp. NPDC051470]|uniref:hypothetical protein n=1 Tax=unclassified Actinoplanes TaxID=2626549 RepID=UPI0034473D8F
MRVALGTRLRTGDVCTQSGVWRVIKVTTSSTPMQKGQAMPAHAGRSVVWELVQAY